MNQSEYTVGDERKYSHMFSAIIPQSFKEVLDMHYAIVIGCVCEKHGGSNPSDG